MEVIRALRGAIPRPKMIAMSGGVRTGLLDLLDAAAAFGAARTLRKPFEARDLRAAIRELLGGPGL